MFTQSCSAQSGGNLRSNRLAYQRPDRRPDRIDAKPLPGNPIDHRWPIVPISVDIYWWRIRHEHRMLCLNRGQLVGRTLQHRRMTYDHDLRMDRAFAKEKPGLSAT